MTMVFVRRREPEGWRAPRGRNWALDKVSTGTVMSPMNDAAVNAGFLFEDAVRNVADMTVMLYGNDSGVRVAVRRSV